jgi:hypothetical protein
MAIRRDFYRRQTQACFLPAFIHARELEGSYGLEDVIAVGVRPGYRGNAAPPEESVILMTAEEATGLAAWLGDRAERMMQRRRKKQERKIKRAEARRKS